MLYEPEAIGAYAYAPVGIWNIEEQNKNKNYHGNTRKGKDRHEFTRIEMKTS